MARFLPWLAVLAFGCTPAANSDVDAGVVKETNTTANVAPATSATATAPPTVTVPPTVTAPPTATAAAQPPAADTARPSTSRNVTPSPPGSSSKNCSGRPPGGPCAGAIGFCPEWRCVDGKWVDARPSKRPGNPADPLSPGF